ncbi:MAG: FeoB-associated Cys-rich membrane protein [Planctomycetota bacterium]|jgi:hypothetical protein
MAEYIIVGMILALAVFAAVRNIYRRASGQGGCDCQSTKMTCSTDQNCTENDRNA